MMCVKRNVHLGANSFAIRSAGGVIKAIVIKTLALTLRIVELHNYYIDVPSVDTILFL